MDNTRSHFLFYLPLAQIRIHLLSVSEQLILSDDVDDDLTQHIIGTHMDDLTQIYSSHITIRGSATFNNVLLSSVSDNFFSQPIHDINKNVSMLSNNAIIQVDGVPFELLQVPQIFWMKGVDQVFISLSIISYVFNLFY